MLRIEARIKMRYNLQCKSTCWYCPLFNLVLVRSCLPFVYTNTDFLNYSLDYTVIRLFLLSVVCLHYVVITDLYI